MSTSPVWPPTETNESITRIDAALKAVGLAKRPVHKNATVAVSMTELERLALDILAFRTRSRRLERELRPDPIESQRAENFQRWEDNHREDESLRRTGE